MSRSRPAAGIRPGRTIARLALTVAVVLGATLSAWADARTTATGATDGSLQPLRQARFCETPTAFDEAGCVWQTVSLPHRWSPSRPGLSWALYRFEAPHPGGGLQALVAERVSLHARVRVHQPAGTPAAPALESAPLGRGEHSMVRYWPQIYPLELQQPGESRSMQIDLALRGHDSVKSGLGAVALGSLQAARQWHWRETLLEVDLVLALAAATLVAGVAGLFAGESRSQPGRLLLAFAGLAIVAATRTALNYVVTPPLPLAWWTALNVWLLIVVAVLTCAGVGQHLWRGSRASVLLAVAGAGASALVLSLLPGRTLYVAAEWMLGLLAVMGLVLLMQLAVRTWLTRDSLGALLLGALMLILGFGVHDLAVHLGPSSLSDRYLQKWSTPMLVIVMIVLLARRVAVQRSLESALQQEMASKEELLRDLHDGVGSRLVALDFHARQDGSATLVQEIEGLIHELQVIQRAVRAGPTSLDALLADLRHLYARVGGGHLPLRWDVPDAATGVMLSAEQAVAVLRILEEAIANAMKHARPTQVVIRVEPDADDPAGAGATVVSVIDDGVGAFRPGSHGGLNHIRLRAQRAGLGLELREGSGSKAVRIRVPPTAASRPAGDRLRDRLGAWAASRVRR